MTVKLSITLHKQISIKMQYTYMFNRQHQKMFIQTFTPGKPKRGTKAQQSYWSEKYIKKRNKTTHRQCNDNQICNFDLDFDLAKLDVLMQVGRGIPVRVWIDPGKIKKNHGWFNEGF